MNDTTVTLDQRLNQLQEALAAAEFRIQRDIAEYEYSQRRYLDKLTNKYNLEIAQAVYDDFQDNPDSWSHVETWDKRDYVGNEGRLQDEIARAQAASNWTPERSHLHVARDGDSVSLYRKAVQS